jgi:DNA-binding transcriptional LysR family regulator
MDLGQLDIFLAVATEKSFSRAAQRLLRTQPAVSLAVQKLERELGERLVDRSLKDGTLTDAGRIVLEYARKFENLRRDLRNALTELRDSHTGRLTIGANESGAIYLLKHIHKFRALYPGVKLEVRRSLSSQIPHDVLDNAVELGVISYEPGDRNLESMVIYTDHLAFTVYPSHRLASRKQVSIRDLGAESFIAHNVLSPYRQTVLMAFQKHKVPLIMDLEMPSLEAIKKAVQLRMGVAFFPRMVVEQELEAGTLVEVPVKELRVERKIRLVHPLRRELSHAARAFLEVVRRSGAVQEEAAAGA